VRIVCKNIIFLDIDGVLNVVYADRISENDDCWYVSDKAIKRLKEICASQNADIVFNATSGRALFNGKFLDVEEYRNREGIPLMQLLRENEINVIDYAFTPEDAYKIRSICKYLIAHPEITNFIIIEDGNVLDPEDISILSDEHKVIAEKISTEQLIDVSGTEETTGSIWIPRGLDDAAKDEAIRAFQILAIESISNEEILYADGHDSQDESIEDL
jgi:hypothetical protein